MSDRLNEHYETQAPIEDAYIPVLGEAEYHEDIDEWIAIDERGEAHVVPPPPDHPQIVQPAGVGDAKVEMRISWTAPYHEVVRFANQPGQMPSFMSDGVPTSYASQASPSPAPASSYFPPDNYPVQPGQYYGQPEEPAVAEFTDTHAQPIPIITTDLPQPYSFPSELPTESLASVMSEHAVEPIEVADTHKNRNRLTLKKARRIGAVALVVIVSGPLYQAANAGPHAASICAENGLASVWADPLCPITSFFGELVNPGNILNYVVEKP